LRQLDGGHLSNTRARLCSWLLNGLTLLVLGISVWLVCQPQSVLRAKWESHKSEVASRAAARESWPRLLDVSVPLYEGDDPALVIEFSNYNCLFCRVVSDSVDSASVAGARIAQLLVPSGSDAVGVRGALAALCAAASGEFSEMHAHLMHTLDWQTDTDWRRLARAAGIQRISEFEACVRSDEMHAELERHRSLALSLGVTHTPTFISRSSVIRGVTTPAKLVSLGNEP
jgi:protein-disulfide isomerase